VIDKVSGLRLPYAAYKQLPARIARGEAAQNSVLTRLDLLQRRETTIHVSSLLTCRSFEETSELRERLAALERLLGDQVPNLSNANGPKPHIDQAHQEPSRMFAKSSGAMDRPSEPEREGGHTGDEGALAAFAIAHSIGGSSSGPVFDVSSILDQPLVFDFNTTPQDHQIQVSQGQGSGSLVSLRSVPSVSPQDLAHGTLVLGKSGETKYFGHTAASEWLKNVRQVLLM
jgi:hypothetical protein